jgi:hypothetical protein
MVPGFTPYRNAEQLTLQISGLRLAMDDKK